MSLTEDQVYYQEVRAWQWDGLPDAKLPCWLTDFGKRFDVSRETVRTDKFAMITIRDNDWNWTYFVHPGDWLLLNPLDRLMVYEDSTFHRVFHKKEKGGV